MFDGTQVLQNRVRNLGSMHPQTFGGQKNFKISARVRTASHAINLMSGKQQLRVILKTAVINQSINQ